MLITNYQTKSIFCLKIIFLSRGKSQKWYPNYLNILKVVPLQRLWLFLCLKIIVLPHVYFSLAQREFRVPVAIKGNFQNVQTEFS